MNDALFAMTRFRARDAMGSMNANCTVRTISGATASKPGTIRPTDAAARRRCISVTMSHPPIVPVPAANNDPKAKATRTSASATRIQVPIVIYRNQPDTLKSAADLGGADNQSAPTGTSSRPTRPNTQAISDSGFAKGS